MKFVKLLTSAYVNGVVRRPDEGVLCIADDEAARLLENQAAIDVTDDFSAEQREESVQQSITVQSGPVTQPNASAPHQSEIAPVAPSEDAPVHQTEQLSPAKAKAASPKE